MRKRKRTYNPRLIKATAAYSPRELADVYRLHKNAVLRWKKDGLKPIDESRKYLFRGNEIIRFLPARQKSRKRKCTQTEFYCFKCRVPRGARDGAASVVIESSSRFRVKAQCAVCGTPVNKVQGIQNLPQIENCFRVLRLEGRRLIECANPSVNSDIGEKP